MSHRMIVKEKTLIRSLMDFLPRATVGDTCMVSAIRVFEMCQNGLITAAPALAACSMCAAVVCMTLICQCILCGSLGSGL